MEEAKTEKYKTFHKGQVIFREGQHNPVAYMVKKGAVSIYKVASNKRVVLAEVKPGHIFGEMALISGEPFHATAEASVYTEVIVIDRDVLKSLLLKCPNPIQRLVKYFMERLRVLDAKVAGQPSSDIFFSVCQILELQHRARCTEVNGGLSYAEISRTIKNILLISQLEIDGIMEKLYKLGLLEIRDVKGATFRKNPFGEMTKAKEFLKDRMVSIKDPDGFLGVARNVSREIPVEDAPFTQSMEFIDIHDFATLVGSKAEMIYKKIAHQEIPDNLFFLHRARSVEWAESAGPDFFKKTKRRRLNLDELETVDDIVFVDNNTLREVFRGLGFHKLAVIFAAGSEETRGKILSNLSKKIATVIQDEGARREVDETELADIEDELFSLVRSIKGK